MDNEGFAETLLECVDLSTLITKNRGINYDLTMKSEQKKLQEFIVKYGKEVTEYDYTNVEQFNQKNKLKIGTNLQKARFLFFKYRAEQGSISLVHMFESLAESAKVMDFECDDTICTNAQACQTQIKKFLKFLLSNLSKRRVKEGQGESILLPKHMFDFCYKMG